MTTKAKFLGKNQQSFLRTQWEQILETTIGYAHTHYYVTPDSTHHY